VVIAFYYELNMPSILHKVRDVGYKLTIPSSVYAEIKRPTFKTLMRSVNDGIIEILDPIPTNEIKKLKDRYPNLKVGELEVILWGAKMGLQKKKYYCVLDDEAARKVATRKNIVFTGTLGLIKFLERRRAINRERSESIIEQLKQTRFRI